MSSAMVNENIEIWNIMENIVGFVTKMKKKEWMFDFSIERKRSAGEKELTIL